jgi:YgiT-type zinc finger domain-containing protein
MKCVICKKGETSDGTTTVTLERDKAVLVIRGVSAQVCRNCGDAYIGEAITDQAS